jgi:hypothetical protein
MMGFGFGGLDFVGEEGKGLVHFFFLLFFLYSFIYSLIYLFIYFIHSYPIFIFFTFPFFLSIKLFFLNLSHLSYISYIKIPTILLIVFSLFWGQAFPRNEEIGGGR